MDEETYGLIWQDLDEIFRAYPHVSAAEALALLISYMAYVALTDELSYKDYRDAIVRALDHQKQIFDNHEN